MAGLERLLFLLLEGLIEAVYPEQCARCGSDPDQVPWCARGPLVPGLRALDVPHLCHSCHNQLAAPEPVRLRLGWQGGGGTEVLGAVPTSAELVHLVGAWKYRSLRGLAWPLAELLSRAVMCSGVLRGRGPLALMPVPLHRRRRRIRGFNQADLLARLVALDCGLPVLPGVAIRAGSTLQQARISDPSQRMGNLAGAFRMAVPPGRDAPALVLVDDIITSGATCGELARTLQEGGWRVPLVIGLGALGPGRRNPGARSHRVPVDTV